MHACIEGPGNSRKVPCHYMILIFFTVQVIRNSLDECDKFGDSGAVGAIAPYRWVACGDPRVVRHVCVHFACADAHAKCTQTCRKGCVAAQPQHVLSLLLSILCCPDDGGQLSLSDDVHGDVECLPLVALALIHSLLSHLPC